MRKGWKALAAAAFGVVVFAVAVPSGQPDAATGGQAAREQPGSVILLRGLANVFSRGMDGIGAKLRQQGISAKVENHAAWRGLATKIEARYAEDKRAALPVIIMGHSFGANAAVLMAAELGKHQIPVDLVVTFDATSVMQVSANVRHAVNFYYPAAVGQVLKPGPGFRGKLENIDVTDMKLGIDHLNIEKNPKLQDQVIAEVVTLMRRRHASR